MAISGSFYGTSSNTAIKPKISWSAEKNADGNASLVTATLSYSRTNNIKTYGRWAGTLTINGNTASASGRYIEIVYGSETVVMTHTVEVPHEEDGTKTITISAAGGIPETTLTATSISGSVTLEIIPRAASIAATDASIGSVSMVTISKKSDVYTYAVAWKFGKLSGYLTTDGISQTLRQVTASGLAFALPEDFYYEIPSKSWDTCTLTCTTYLNGTAVGAPQKTTFKVKADPARCGPLLTAAVEDINGQTLALTGSKNRFLRYASTALCAMTAQPRFGATIARRKIAGQVLSADALTIERIDTDAVRFSVTDSRGFTAETVVQLELVPYFTPSLRIGAARTDATSGQAKLICEGSFYRGNFGTTENSLQMHYRIEEGDSVQLQPDLDGNSFSLEHLLQDLDYTRSFSVTVTASDALYSTAVTTRINPGIPVFDWGESDMVFHVPVSVSGNRLTELAEPAEAGDGVNLAYARQNFAPLDTSLSKCVAVTTAGTDLNNYKQEGWYYFSSAMAPAKPPAGTNGWLHTVPAGNSRYIKQFWYRMGTKDSNDHQSYVRTYSDSAGWSGWTGYVTEKDAFQRVKIWENASVDSSFPAQTLALDLTDYDGVEILYYAGATTENYLNTGMITKETSSIMWYVTASLRYLHRAFSVSNTGIVFNTATNTGTVPVDKICLPYIIYGVKGVR